MMQKWLRVGIVFGVFVALQAQAETKTFRVTDVSVPRASVFIFLQRWDGWEVWGNGTFCLPQFELISPDPTGFYQDAESAPPKLHLVDSSCGEKLTQVKRLFLYQTGRNEPLLETSGDVSTLAWPAIPLGSSADLWVTAQTETTEFTTAPKTFQVTLVRKVYPEQRWETKPNQEQVLALRTELEEAQSGKWIVRYASPGKRISAHEKVQKKLWARMKKVKPELVVEPVWVPISGWPRGQWQSIHLTQPLSASQLQKITRGDEKDPVDPVLISANTRKMEAELLERSRPTPRPWFSWDRVRVNDLPLRWSQGVAVYRLKGSESYLELSLQDGPLRWKRTIYVNRKDAPDPARHWKPVELQSGKNRWREYILEMTSP